MLPKNLKTYGDNTIIYVEERGYLHIELLASNDLENKKKIGSVVENVIRPLLSEATKCYLYDSNAQFTETKKSRGKIILNIKEQLPEIEKYMYSDTWQLGTIVWLNRKKDINLLNLFKSSLDPSALGNPGVVMSRAAISFLKRQTTEDKNLIGFSITRGLELGSMLIFSSKDTIGNIAKLALNNCKYSNSHLKVYDEKNMLANKAN